MSSNHNYKHIVFSPYVKVAERKLDQSGDITDFYENKDIQDIFQIFRDLFDGDDINKQSTTYDRFITVGEQFATLKQGIQEAIIKHNYKLKSNRLKQINANPFSNVLFDKIILWAIHKMCKICKQKYINMINPVKIPCGCIFCNDCAYNYFVSDDNDDCPTCLKTIDHDSWEGFELGPNNEESKVKQQKYYDFKNKLQPLLASINKNSILNRDYDIIQFCKYIGKAWLYVAVSDSEPDLDVGTVYMPLNGSKSDKFPIFDEILQHFPLYCEHNGDILNDDYTTSMNRLLHLIADQVQMTKERNWDKIYVIPVTYGIDAHLEGLLQFAIFVHSLKSNNRRMLCYGPKYENWKSKSMFKNINAILKKLYESFGVPYYDLFDEQKLAKAAYNEYGKRFYILPTNGSIDCTATDTKSWLTQKFYRKWICPQFTSSLSVNHKTWNAIFVSMLGLMINKIDNTRDQRRAVDNFHIKKSNRLVRLQEFVYWCSVSNNLFPTYDSNNKKLERGLLLPGHTKTKRDSYGFQKCAKKNVEIVNKFGIGKFINKKVDKRGRKRKSDLKLSQIITERDSKKLKNDLNDS